MAEIEKGPVQAASNQETTDLIARLRTLQDSIPQDEELRKELYSTVRNLSLALESPIDTVKRICYLVRSNTRVEKLTDPRGRLANSTCHDQSRD